MPEPALLAAAAVVGLGAWLQATVGFGIALLAAPLLALLDPTLVPGPLMVAALVLGLLTVTRDRSAVAVREIGWALVGRVPGSLVGLAALLTFTVRSLSLTLGTIVLVAVAVSVVGVRVPISRRTLVAAGLVSGFTATTTAVGGPPLALLYQDRDGPSVRGNLGGFFLVGGIITVSLLVLGGEFAGEELRASLALLPGVVLGFAASTWTVGLVDGDRVRPAVQLVAAVSAAALIVRTLLG